MSYMYLHEKINKRIASRSVPVIHSPHQLQLDCKMHMRCSPVPALGTPIEGPGGEKTVRTRSSGGGSGYSHDAHMQFSSSSAQSATVN